MDVVNSNSQFGSLKSVVKTNEVNYHNSQIQFENGIITYSTLLEVKIRLYTAQSDLIQSKYRAKMSELILDFYFDEISL
jgi:outer membrane protein TolC